MRTHVFRTALHLPITLRRRIFTRRYVQYNRSRRLRRRNAAVEVSVAANSVRLFDVEADRRLVRTSRRDDVCVFYRGAHYHSDACCQPAKTENRSADIYRLGDDDDDLVSCTVLRTERRRRRVKRPITVEILFSGLRARAQTARE